MKSIQFFLTPAAGKALIARGLLLHPDILRALKTGRILVIGGTTNAFAGNALLEYCGAAPSITFPAFHRGVSVPHGSRILQEAQLGDLLLEQGVPRFTDDLPAACSELRQGDVILKGANAVHPDTRTAGILIGNTGTGGTIAEAMRPVYARRVKLILPVGLEKRVGRPVPELMASVNDPEASGLRLAAAPGEAFTEIDAIRLLTGSDALLIGAGGVNGGEGGVYLQASGGDLTTLSEIIREIREEAPVTV